MSDPIQITPDLAWTLLSKVAQRASEEEGLFALSDAGELTMVDQNQALIQLDLNAPRNYRAICIPDEEAKLLLDVLMPVCFGRGCGDAIVAHLAQSLDGRIATETGKSKFISGKEDLRHTHQLRALFDAVVIGVGTAHHDNPLLTARLANGPHPARIVIDPLSTLHPELQVMRDKSAATFLASRMPYPFPLPDHVQRIPLEQGNEADFNPRELREKLKSLGLRRLFIEGGGRTVSRFVDERMVHRLHLAIAPTLFGSGRLGFSLRPIDSLSEAIKVERQVFAFGEDMLVDCAFPHLDE